MAVQAGMCLEAVTGKPGHVLTMGAKDKHKRGKSRNNPVFKVVGGKVAKAKGKPQPVDIKLKKLGKPHQRHVEVENLDKKFTQLQQTAVSMQKKPVKTTKIQPVTTNHAEVNMDAILDDFTKIGNAEPSLKSVPISAPK
eukprot:maker-scaffold675_size187964-snap-gene-0.30 protein:Tk03272 transcript:maker-scaffold675_size187964-snap-gene-0.30-mRNA-1 annotation:"MULTISPECIES: hypothetical protein"